GPRPSSSKSAGGGIVNIEQSGGQLIIHGRGQDIRSDACWSRNPSIRRQASGFASNTWTTKCKTAANDPREEQGTYTLRVTGSDALTYQDVSRYNWALNQSRCVATFTTTQTLTRRGASAEIAKAPPVEKPAPPPEPEEKERVCTPGAPARMLLRPRKAEIEVGQRVCFKPRVVDASDCVIKDAPVQWSLSHNKALRGTLVNGCFTAADNAAEAEGEFKVLAALGQIRADATVSVAPVDLSALIAKRMGGAALTGFEESVPLEAAPKSVTRVATRHEPQAASASPRKLIGIALGVAATGLALAALWLSRRKPSTVVPATVTPGPMGEVAATAGPNTITLDAPPRADRPPNKAAEASNVPSSIPPPLPPRGATPHKPAEVAAAPAPAKTLMQGGLAPAAAPVSSVASEPSRPISSGPPPSGEAWICPKCRVGYPAQQGKCPKDGTKLMPYAEFARSRRKSEEERTKRCPRCGQVFPAHAAFCAEDGTPLVDT
ncbi:MAG TPA: hypothetical protein VJR89_11225, partial [Polyangiales bacterium]|nr:hypothetical protein [Polyangiales bacterium]